MKKRITATILAVLLSFSCYSCKGKGAKDDDNTSWVFQKAESYETVETSSGIKYKLRSDFKPLKEDDDRNYTYKGMEINIYGPVALGRKGMTPQTVNDYLTKAVFRDDEVVVNEVFRSENYDIAQMTLACKPDEGKDYYSSFAISYGDTTFSVSICCNKEHEELAKQVCTELLDSVEFPDTFVPPEGGTDFENKYYNVSCGDRWYEAPARSVTQEEENESNGSVSFRYKVSENLSEFWSTVSISPKLDSFHSTIKDYAYSEYESKKESSMVTYSEMPKSSTFNGDDSYTFEYKYYTSMYSDCNMNRVVNFVEHNGIIYQVTYSYGMADDTDAILADIQQILDSIEFSDLSKEEIYTIEEGRLETYSTENFSFKVNNMFEKREHSYGSDDTLWFSTTGVSVSFYEEEDRRSMTPEERAEDVAYYKTYYAALEENQYGEKIDHGVKTIGDNTFSYVFDYFDDDHDSWDTSTYYIEKNGKVLTVCIDAPAETFKRYSGVIEKMLASVEYIGE